MVAPQAGVDRSARGRPRRCTCSNARNTTSKRGRRDKPQNTGTRRCVKNRGTWPTCAKYPPTSCTDRVSALSGMRRDYDLGPSHDVSSTGRCPIPSPCAGAGAWQTDGRFERLAVTAERVDDDDDRSRIRLRSIATRRGHSYLQREPDVPMDSRSSRTAAASTLNLLLRGPYH